MGSVVGDQRRQESVKATFKVASSLRTSRLRALLAKTPLRQSALLRLVRPDDGVRAYASAITSISTNTSLGKRETSTVDRAGGVMLKNRP